MPQLMRSETNKERVNNMQKLFLNAQKKQLIKIAFKDLKRLDRLISDISSSSRLEVELAKGEYEIIDIRDVLESVMEVTRTNITKKINIEINLKLPKNKIEVLGIGDRIAQVFYNLVDNAISFSKEGASIDISALTTENEAIIVELINFYIKNYI